MSDSELSDLDKLRALSFRELRYLCVSALTLPMVALLLKFRGFRHTEKLLSRFSRSAREDEANAARVDELARMVSVAANRGLYRAQCLPQAISLWWMLGVMGIASTVRFGIYKTADGVMAHAWVLYNDEVVIGELAELDDYTPLLDVNIERPE